MNITCRGCKSQIPDEILIKYSNMPKSAQHFPDASNVEKEQGVDILLRQCPYCGLVQAAGEPVSYFRDVIRSSSVSEEMYLFRVKQYREWVDKFGLANRKLIEIGAGSGEYMRCMEEAGTLVYGLEHRHEAVLLGQEAGHLMLEGFIENKDYQIPDGPFDGFYSMNFLEHIPDPSEFLKGIVNNLRENGIGLVEVPNFNMILKNNLYSEFIQDHLNYFTKETLCNLLERSGFDVISCVEIWYDYIISASVKKRRPLSVDGLRKEQENLYTQMQAYLEEKKREKKVVAVWGAGHQALANLSLLGMEDKVSFCLDSAGFKQNHYTPATHIPIVSPEFLQEGKVQAVIIMGASYSDEIKRIMEEKYPQIEKVIVRDHGVER